MREGVVVLLLWSAAASAAQTPDLPELTRRMLAESLAPALEAAAATDARAGFALRMLPGKVVASSLLSGYADHLLDQGHEVWELTAAEKAPAGAFLLEITPIDVGVTTGERKRSFLGMGGVTLERTAQLTVEFRLSDPASGQLLYDQERSVRRVDWVAESENEPLAAGDPLFVANRQAPRADTVMSKASWLERGIAVGLLGSIIFLYFAGSS